MRGIQKLAADLKVSHWDPPPPDRLDSLDDLMAADAIRFANELRAWVEVEDGRVTGYGHLGGGRIGPTTLRAGSKQVAFPALALPDLRAVAELPVERFDQVERRLRGVEGLSFARRKGRGTPPGRRTATLRAVTACRVAVVPEGLLDREALAELASRRRRASRNAGGRHP